MKRLFSMFRQDLVLAWRNGQIAVAMGIAALMIALILLLPHEIATGPGEYVLDEVDGRPVRAAIMELGGNPASLPESRSELDTLLEANSSAIGIVVTGAIEAPQVEIIVQTAVPAESVNLLRASIEMVIRSAQEGAVAEAPVIRLRPEAQPVPLNLAGLPIFLAFEVAILGFLLVAVFVFQEKQEGTIRAYRVSPAGLWPYIASKTALFTVLAIAYGTVVVIAGRGRHANWPAVLALIVWGSAFMTIFGLGFAAWFRNLSHWFFPGLAVLVLNLLPFIAYIYPAFDPAWLRVIPSYALVFALREALFQTGNPGLIGHTLLVGLVWLAGALVFTSLSVRTRLLKGG